MDGWKRALTYEELITLVEESIVSIKVCVPSDDFYARRGDFCEDYFYCIDPRLLIEKLKEATK